MSPTIGLVERGQYEHWALVASVLEHRDNVGAPWLEVAFLLLIVLCFIHCFSIVIPVQLGLIQRHVPARCVCCDSASMRMHGDEIKGTELSSAFGAILQLEIKSVANVPLPMFDRRGLPAELVLHGKPCLCNHEGSVPKIA
jgi:hypothetical protein